MSVNHMFVAISYNSIKVQHIIYNCTLYHILSRENSQQRKVVELILGGGEPVSH